MSPSGFSFSAALAFALLLSGSPFALAQETDAAPDGQSPTPASDRPKSDRGRPSGGSDSAHWRRDSSRYSSAFSNLSEEERKRIREALKQVWSDPEVIAAKKSLQDSTDHYRETLRTALAKVDPEMQEILKKMMMDHRGPSGHGGPSPANRDWGDPNQPGFARSVLQRTHLEIFEKMNPDFREKFKTAHEAAVETPAVREALKFIEESKDGRKKMEGIRGLREAYRAAILEASPELKPFVRSFAPPANPGPRPPRPDSDRRPPREKSDPK